MKMTEREIELTVASHAEVVQVMAENGITYDDLDFQNNPVDYLAFNLAHAVATARLDLRKAAAELTATLKPIADGHPKAGPLPRLNQDSALHTYSEAVLTINVLREPLALAASTRNKLLAQAAGDPVPSG